MKKGAYDLGRKSLYYIVVIIIIALLFGYMNNRFREYQTDKISHLNDVTDLVMIKNVVKCISQKDLVGNIDENMLKKDALIDCLGDSELYTNKAINLEIKGLEIETQDHFFEYNNYKRSVIYQGNKETLKIGIEKYPEIK